MKQIGISLLLLLTMVVGLTACRPRNVLSPHQMEDLLVDLHRTSGIVYAAGYSREHDSVALLTYDEVFARHHTTRQAFDSSLVWYTDHPMIFDKIYPHVLERLKTMNDNVLSE